MTDKEKEKLNAVTTWFHVLHSMVESGEIGDMTPAELRVYLITKSYVNFSSGDAFPSMELIAKKAKLSKRAVSTAIKLLETRNLIATRKEGRKNVYVVREKIEAFDGSGEKKSIVSFDYLPSGFSEARKQIKNYLHHEKYNGKIIFVETLNFFKDSIQENYHDSSKKINIENTEKSLENMPVDLKNTLLSIKANTGK